MKQHNNSLNYWFTVFEIPFSVSCLTSPHPLCLVLGSKCLETGKILGTWFFWKMYLDTWYCSFCFMIHNTRYFLFQISMILIHWYISYATLKVLWKAKTLSILVSYKKGDRQQNGRFFDYNMMVVYLHISRTELQRRLFFCQLWLLF